MKYTLAIALTLFVSQAALAHELDNDAPVSQKQIELAKDLPQTVVIRTYKNDPTKVEVVQLKEKVPAGKKIANLKFQQLALNGEVQKTEMNSSNELDVTSSTSSWGFAIGYGGNYGYAGYRSPYLTGYGYNRPYYGSYYGGGYGYYRPNYYNNYSSYYTAPYYASTYYGYNYGYQPYYGYSDYNCDYTYYSYGYGNGYGYGGY